jgi:SAM-dependent methyltransferase
MYKSATSLNETPENAKKYRLSGIEGTYYLGYRDIPALLKKYAPGKKAVDYGCGTGRSTRFLKSLGFETLGVDTSKEMLTQTLIEDSSHYLHIKSGVISVLDGSCDFFFSCFVFFVVASKEELTSILKEIYRCLREGSIFIVVTGSEYLYSHEWLSYDVNYPENKNLFSGKLVKIQLKDLGLDFINYYWTDSDLCDLFRLVNFNLVEKHFPLGKKEDGYAWKSETKIPPYTVYVLKKDISL